MNIFVKMKAINQIVIYFFERPKKLVIHLIDDFHVVKVPTNSTDIASLAILMASNLQKTLF